MTARPLSTLVCTITPFDPSGGLDEAAATLLYGRLAEAGVGAYVGSSSPGEGYSLSLAETERLYEIAHSVMKSRVPVRAMGVEPHTVEELLALIEIAERVGLDAMQLYCLDAGHGNKPNDEELGYYFRTLLERMTIPAVVSSHVFSGYVLSLELLDQLLGEYPHLIGINCTNPDISYVSRLVDMVGGRADVHVGGPMQALSALALGAQGFLGTDGNLAPRLCASLIDAYAAGDLAAASAAYAKIIRLFSLNTWPGGSMRWLKAAMRVLDLPGWTLRGPWRPLPESVLPTVAQRLADLDFTDGEGLAPPRWP